MKKKRSVLLNMATDQDLKNYAPKEGYLNVSEFIRDAIREKIQEVKNREAVFQQKEGHNHDKRQH